MTTFADTDIPVKNLISLWDSRAERCGFVLRDGTIAVMTNVAKDPKHHWRMDLNEQTEFIKKNGPDIIAVWHTHPSNERYPSEEDKDGIHWLYLQGCPWLYLIVTEDHVESHDFT